MTTSVFQNLREALDISIENFSTQSNICIDELILIEKGYKKPTQRFANAYAELFKISPNFTIALLVGSKSRLPLLNNVRNCFLALLNSYLKAAIWMKKFDDTN